MRSARPISTLDARTMMKRHHLVAVAVGMILLTSCSTTNFTEYHDQNILEGKGGTIRVVKGIDIWENGEPDRKYQILGVIDDSRNDGLIPQIRKDTAIALVARERGGDAVILSDSSLEIRDVDMNDGVARYRRMTKILLVRYVQ